MPNRKIIHLTEYRPQLFAPDEIPATVAELLWRGYGPQIEVESPSLKTGNRWKLTAQSWVGFIPATPALGFALHPKIPLRNFFGMIEYAHALPSLRFLDGLFQADSLQEFYEQLALILAQQVLIRFHNGIYSAYLEHTDQLPYLPRSTSG